MEKGVGPKLLKHFPSSGGNVQKDLESGRNLTHSGPPKQPKVSEGIKGQIALSSNRVREGYFPCLLCSALQITIIHK